MTNPAQPTAQPNQPLSARETVANLISGKKSFAEGEEALFKEDWVAPYKGPQKRMPDLSIGDPMAFARRMDRFFKADHDKLDGLSNLDELFHEMGQDALVSASLGHIDDAMTAAPMTIQVDEKYRAYCEYVTREAAALPQDTRLRALDSYARGFVLGEVRLERLERGPFAGLHTVAEIRRLERDAYELIEDNFSRPSQLQIDVAPESYLGRSSQVGRQGKTGIGRPGHAYPTYQPYNTVVITPNDPEWERYLFLTWPPRSNRTAGVSALGAAWPWYYFASHLRQWMMTLGERLGTPILVGEFTGVGTPKPGNGYAQTREEVFATLESIQTNFRGLLPEGYKLSAVQDGAQGKADLLESLFNTSVRMIQLAIERQVVAGGLEAQGGTLGANQTIFSGTFGGLIAAQNRRQASIMSNLLEMLIRINFGVQTDVDVTFQMLDPETEAKRVERVEKGISLGIIDKTEPWLRTLFEAPALDEETLALTKAEAERRTLAGIDTPSDEEAKPGTSTEDIAALIQAFLEGRLGLRVASLQLATMLGLSIEEASQILVEEKATRVAVTPVAVPGSVPVEAEAEPDVIPDGPATVAVAPEVARAAAVGLEVAGANRDLGFSPRAVGAARILVSGLEVKPSIVQRIAAWHDLHPPVTGIGWGDGASPSIEWIEHLLHGGDTAADWASGTPEEPEAFSEKVMVASHRVKAAILDLANKVKSAEYDHTRPPPCRRGLERAVGRVYNDSLIKYRVASDIREGVQARLASELPSCDSEEARLSVLTGIADHYSDPTRFTNHG